MAFVFPVHLFRPKGIRAELRNQSLSGGVAISGEEDFIVTDGGGRWDIEYSGIDLHTPAQVRAWEAWLAHLDGGARDVLVPMVSIGTAPRASMFKFPQPVPPLADRETVFPEEVRYTVPVIEATIDAAADLRATQIALTITKGGTIKGGERFSIGDRGYQIIREVDDGIYEIRPPLRASVTTEDVPNFDWPVVRCRMAPDDASGLSLRMGRFGSPSIKFLEMPPGSLGDTEGGGTPTPTPTPTIREATFFQNTFTPLLFIDLPEGATEGDLAILMVAGGDGITAFDPSGWTTVDTNSPANGWNASIYKKTLDAADISAGAIQTDWSGNFQKDVMLWIFEGSATVIDYDIHSSMTSGLVNGQAFAFGSVIPSGAMVLMAATGRGNSTPTVTPGTLDDTDSKANGSMSTYHYAMPSAGTGSFTPASIVSAYEYVFMMAAVQ